MKLITDMFLWRVEFTWKRPAENGARAYTTNYNISVVTNTAQGAIGAVHEHYPDATIIKVFRGDRWGEGIIINEGIFVK